MKRLVIAGALIVAVAGGYFALRSPTSSPADLLFESRGEYPGVKLTHCAGKPLGDLPPTPMGAPLRLARIHCGVTLARSLPRGGGPVMSPDGRRIASLIRGEPREPEGLRIIEMADPEAAASAPVDLGVSGQMTWGSPQALAWRPDSRGLFAAVQPRAKPSGFPTGAMRPVSVAPDGTLTPLPALTSGAGPLDRLLFLDGQGLALAAFGTEGDAHRPPHDDPDPTYAVVDVVGGKVLATLPLRSLGLPLTRVSREIPRPQSVTAVKRPDGRVTVLFGFMFDLNLWVVWTQGEAPRRMERPWPKQLPNFAMTPDGEAVLVDPHASAHIICSEAPPNMGCRVIAPVEGVLAELRSLRTGKVLWSIRRRFTQWRPQLDPSVSPDGRLGLIGERGPDGKSAAALIDMRDGRVLQVIPAAGDNQAAMGFTRDGKSVWVYSPGRVAIYTLRAGA